jgi:hypothetical protein
VPGASLERTLRARAAHEQAPWPRQPTKRLPWRIAWNFAALTRGALDSRASHVHVVRPTAHTIVRITAATTVRWSALNPSTGYRSPRSVQVLDRL